MPIVNIGPAAGTFNVDSYGATPSDPLVFVVDPDSTSNFSFTGTTPFEVQFNESVSTTVNNANPLTFGAGTEPTVTVATGVDAGRYTINADGDSLEVNLGDSSSFGLINADAVSDTAGPGMVINAGNDVTLEGSINGPNFAGVTTDITALNDFTVNGTMTGSSNGDNILTVGDRFDLNGNLNFSNGNNANILNIGNDANFQLDIDVKSSISGGSVDMTVGDGLFVGRNIDARNNLTAKIVIGDNATITEDTNFLGSGDSTLVVGDNLTVTNGYLEGSNGVDNWIIGNNWSIEGTSIGISLNGGNDQLRIGYADPNFTGPNVLGDAGTDGITMTLPPTDPQRQAMIDAANAAGWDVDLTEGTVSENATSSNMTYAGRIYGTFEEAGTPVVCFTEGTQIAVADGETVSVEDLKQGDMVMTADNGLQPVKWIGVRTAGADELAEHANMRPIRIRAGALGHGVPNQDLLVSPQHRILVRSAIAERMFGENEVLVAAKQLVLIDGIDVADDVTKVTYVHFLCDRHEVVFANGAASESLYTGPEALKSIPPASVSEVLTLFPELCNVDYKALSARPFVNGRKGRQLAVRHKNKDRPLLGAYH